jgi:hypothetical protein
MGVILMDHHCRPLTVPVLKLIIAHAERMKYEECRTQLSLARASPAAKTSKSKQAVPTSSAKNKENISAPMTDHDNMQN